MAEEQRSPGLYQSWNEDLRKRYIVTLDDIIKTLQDTPRFPFIITEVDVKKIVEALIALNETDENIFEKIEELKQAFLGTDEPFTVQDLYNPVMFSMVKGVVRGMAIRKIEKGELKPGNPLEEEVKRVKNNPDLVMEDDTPSGD